MRKIMWLALCGMLAACGGSDPGPVKSDTVRLLSTVPRPNGLLDRWGELRFTFSAPVDWAETQFVTCTSPGCRSPLVPYRFVSTGIEVVGTPVLPPEFGQSYSMRVTPLLTVKDANGNTAANIDFAWSVNPPGTRVTADVTADTVLAAAGSPYWFDPAVRIRAKLTVPVGVEATGDLVTAGTGSVEAIGTAGARIRISNAVLSGAARLSYVDLKGAVSVSVTGDVDHVAVYCGRLANGSGQPSSFSGSLTDSTVSGCAVPSLTGSIQRTRFLNTQLPLGGTPAAPWSAATVFSNNFANPYHPDSYSGLYGYVTVQASAGSIRGNSFVGFGAGYFQVQPGSAAADLSGNWWSTTDTTVINSYFSTTQLGSPFGAMPTATPILTAPDPATPTG